MKHPSASENPVTQWGSRDIAVSSLEASECLACRSVCSLGINRGNANKEIFVGIISKLYKIQGTKITKAITIGSRTVQQKDIS